VIAIDLSGSTVGRLKVQSLGAPLVISGRTRRRWICKCECGRETAVLSLSLLSGNTTSCGCARIDAITRHGKTRTAEHQAWRDMLDRCHNHKNSRYADYGGRGITVCQLWLRFESFIASMGQRPSAAYSLDRVDNEGIYQPDNCRWATRSQQQSNRRRRSGCA
jgi:hypothetical protein